MLKWVDDVERVRNAVHLLHHFPLVLERFLRERIVRLNVEIFDCVRQHEAKRVQKHAWRRRVDFQAVRVVSYDHVADLRAV